MRKLLKSYLFEGLLMILLGILMLLRPAESRAVTVVVIGCALVLMGILRIIFFIGVIGGRRAFLDVLIGLLQIAAGVCLIIMPEMFENLFPVIIGVLLFYGALQLFIHGIMAYRGGMRVLVILFALMLACLAVVIIADPDSYKDVMTNLHGVALMIEGFLIVTFMWRILRAGKAMERKADAIRDAVANAAEAHECTCEACRAAEDAAADAADAVPEAVEAVEETVKEAADAVPEAVEAVEETVKDAAEAVPEAVEAVEETVKEAADAVPEAVEAVEETVKEAAEAVPEAVEETVKEAADAVPEAVEAVEETVKEAAEAVPEAVEAVEDAVKEAAEAVPEAVEAVEDAVKKD